MIRVDESDPVGELEPSFPHREVTIKRGTDIKESFEILAEIGRGKFGTVYKCREKSTGLELAAKKVPVKKRDERRTVEREVDIMRRLQHPRLIQLYDAYDSGSFMYVVLELIQGGELFERVIDDDFVLTEKACTVFMRQICEGIDFVHQQNILHLDMKPENILCLTKTGNRIKIIDFGLARLFDPEKKLQVLFGTPEFVAPEVVNFDQIGFGTDMWSVGVICYVLLSGLSPFMGETDIETMANVTIAKYDFDDEAFNEISDDAKDFIRKLLIKDKELRLTATQCLKHAWLVRKPAKVRPPLEKIKDKPKEKEMITSESPVDELDMTKDNLRLFVERWSEHPNSPYIFDKSNHEIVHCPDYENSVAGCSPSPCGSLNSSPDLVCEEIPNITNGKVPKNDTRLSISSLERRASDSSCFVHKKADICLRVNLAEEIKKLSDHLFMLSTMNTDISSKSKTDTGGTVETNIQTVNGLASLESEKESATAAVSVKTATSVETDKNSTTSSKQISRTAVKTAKFVDSQDSYSGSSLPWAKSNRTKFKLTGMNRDVPIVDKSQTSFGDEFHRRRESINKFISSNSEENEESTETSKTTKTGTVQTKTFSSSSTVKTHISSTKTSKVNKAETSKTNGITNGETQRARRFYKTNEQEQLTDNAHHTKDLLLSLLDQYDENQTQSQTQNNTRHKSLSMEWSEEDSLAQKSMNSLNTFYSRQSSNTKETSTKKETVKKKQENTVKTNGFK